MTTNKDSESSILEKNQSSHYYRCVHCHAPCPSLYRHLSASASSIKLTTCTECEQNVDPYIERELLLVAIDCFLAREEAYRHVLYNLDFEWRWKQAIQFIVAWSILNTYLQWETLRVEDPTNESLQDAGYIISLAVLSFAGPVLQWLAIYLYLAQTNKPVHPMLASQVYLALVLPTSFDVVVILVLIWENTKTVRLAGSLLIAYWQGTALLLLSPNMLAPLVGLAVRLLWNNVCSTYLQPFPCVGLDIGSWGSLAEERAYSLCLT
jgi:hypothetical protein